ncbi:MAG TPA: DUF2069 domain-containing protein [Burkholderiaceae bacterium]|nr:DUF2069 domain-containing protein [Burkholderiaceae bacterium]
MNAAPVMEPLAPAAAGLRATRAAVVGLLAALVLLGLVWELWLAPTGSRALALKVLPLVLPLAGVLSLRVRSYQVLSLLVWIYVAEGAMRAASDHGLSAQLAAVEVALCIALFVACVLHVRHRMRAQARP